MSEKPHQSFTNLEIWKRTRILKNEIEVLAKRFPIEEKYRLADQIIRSSRSINSNLAEGHGRYTFKDQMYFCILSRGSLSETYNHLIDAFDCNYINKEELIGFKIKIDQIERMLNGYISFLRAQS
ncbi:MAG: four helix bundle protein [Bacteroidetes bacterium]|nr:four helix bundle protein [Bacteroidota bacterium]